MPSNPYESPTVAQVAEESPSPKRFAWFLVLSVVATGFSLALPFVAVPLSFLMAPAFVRAWQLRRLSLADGETQSGFEFGLLVVASMMYAIPSAVASVVAFCCVCFPGGYAGSYVLSSQFRGENYGVLLIGGIALLVVCTFCGLWAGDSVLRHFGHFIRRPVVGHEASDEDLAAETDE